MAHAVDLLVNLAFFLDIGVRAWDIGLRLVIVIVADEVFDRVIGKKSLELAIELRRECLVGGKNDRRALRLFNDFGHGVGLACACGAEQNLFTLSISHALAQFFDRGGLIPGRRKFGHHFKGFAAFELFSRAHIGRRSVKSNIGFFGMSVGHWRILSDTSDVPSRRVNSSEQ